MSGLVAVPIVQSESLPTYIDYFGKPKDAVRWLFFPGDVIDPRRKRELRGKVSREVFFQNRPFLVMEAGGEEMGSPCLRRTKDTIPRCMLTPLEPGAEWIPGDLVPIGADTWKGVESSGHDQFQSQTPSMGMTGSGLGGNWKGSHPGVKMWPGEVIRQILHLSMNDLGTSKGLVEIEAIAGMTWDEIVREKVQDSFFPEYPNCVTPQGIQPVALSRVEEMIKTSRRQFQPGSMFDQAGDEMLAACDQFRYWARARIGVEEILVGQQATGGFAHKFSEVCESLMAQIEYVPEKRRLENVTGQTAELANLVAQVAASNKGGNDDALRELMGMLAKNQEYLAQVVAGMHLQKPAEVEPTPKTPQIPKIKS